MDAFMSNFIICQENEACMEGKIRIEDHSLAPLLQDYGASEDEYVSFLIEREKCSTLGFKNSEPLVFVNCFTHSRMNAINWILQTRAALGFSFQTAYLSVAYFDRFLSKCSIDSDKSWAMRLLSVACLTLAAKMEEHQVPALPEFQSEDYCFENKVIKRMELLVLSTLEWNMAIITPLVFLPYFITKFCNESQTCHVFSKAMEIIFTLIQEVNLMDHRPSVIAAAATLVAIDQHLIIEAVELKMSSIYQFTFLEAEDIFAYYNQIQSFYNKKTIRHIHFPGPSPLLSSWPVGMAGSSVVASAAMNKRRRPTFNNDKEGFDDE